MAYLLLHFGLKMPAAGDGQVMQMDGTLTVVFGVLPHRIQQTDTALKSPLEVLPVKEHYTRLQP